MQPEEVTPDTTCCLNCKWFEARTGFCRYNPPCAVPHYIKGIGEVVNGTFPKVAIPHLDWCRCFESVHKTLI